MTVVRGLWSDMQIDKKTSGMGNAAVVLWVGAVSITGLDEPTRGQVKDADGRPWRGSWQGWRTAGEMH